MPETKDPDPQPIVNETAPPQRPGWIDQPMSDSLARDILGVARDATADEVRQAYRNQQRANHPDLNPESWATQASQKVNEAYGLLNPKPPLTGEDIFAQERARKRHEQENPEGKKKEWERAKQKSQEKARTQEQKQSTDDDDFYTPPRKEDLYRNGRQNVVEFPNDSKFSFSEIPKLPTERVILMYELLQYLRERNSGVWEAINGEVGAKLMELYNAAKNGEANATDVEDMARQMLDLMQTSKAA
jgi:hypothetical protein